MTDDRSAPKSYAELAGSNMLRRYGLAAIWQLHLAAARAYADGKPRAAMGVSDVAEAAERLWISRQAADRSA